MFEFGQRLLKFILQKHIFIIILLSLAPRIKPNAHEGHAGEHLAGTAQVANMMQYFEKFQDTLTLHEDENYLYVEGNGIPSHPMMVGIRSWQQQVPLPQDFTGDNAFRIPLHPQLLETPEDTPILGPIAVAVNGIPIFNYITQSGNDAYLTGELDEYGGHCGRADDYHYHLPPVFLEDIVGEGEPIAFGLDGLPVYASNPDMDKPLDVAHGYFDADGNYRYVSSTEAPYMIGAYRADPALEFQPHTDAVRPPYEPLNGAVITGFSGSIADGYELAYEISGQTYKVQYTINVDGSYDFDFISPDGSVRSEHYQKPPSSIWDFLLH
ncbi:YHYH protein [bacterium]|nr:YHYH protein [bacterium]